MTGAAPLLYHTGRGVVFYTPTTAQSDAARLARFPEPPCRPRQRRPHSIHVTRLPADFVSVERKPPPAPKKPPKPSRLRIGLRKLASRDSTKRVLGSIFPSLSAASPSASTAASPATPEFARAASPALTRPPSFSAGLSDPSSLIYRRRSTLDTAPLIEFAMPEPAVSGPVAASSPDTTPRGSFSAPSVKEIPRIHEKPVCSANGVVCHVVLAEPTIFLTGLDHDGHRHTYTSSTSAMLRGVLRLTVTKNVKLKAVTLKFTGRARTEWPEGIPPTKTETFEEESLRTQILPFFNAMYAGSESSYGTLCNYTLNQKSATSSITSLNSNKSSTSLALPTTTTGLSGISLPIIGSRSNRSSAIISAKELKRLSLQSNQSRSFQKGDSPCGPTPQQKGYTTFHPGVYEYSFEIPIDNNNPETTDVPLGSVKWMLEVLIERNGTFKPNLIGYKEVPVVRSPSEDSLELVEPISISRTWEDQLFYEIMISGKSFPLGTKIPIAFKLTPLAKVRVHKLKVYVTENIEYFTNSRKVTRKDATRKILLLEKSAGKPLAKEYSSSDIRILAGGEQSREHRETARDNMRRHRERVASLQGMEPEPLPDASDNLLGDLDLGEQYWGQTEIEMNVQLPTCDTMKDDKTKRMVHDCTWKNVNVHHWIKLVMRISRLDPEDPERKKRRHYEISIDSPFTILNCRATRENLMLPEYSGVDSASIGQQHACGCPNAAATTTVISESSSQASASSDTISSGEIPDGPERFTPPDLARLPQAHLPGSTTVQRPMHMLRQPSFNPPAFDAEMPPPLPTPPPLYDHVVGTPSHDGLADYFARLGREYDEDNNSDDEDVNRAASRGRVNVANPRTPGGRIARSMDIDRHFMFNPSVVNDILRRESVANTLPAETAADTPVSAS